MRRVSETVSDVLETWEVKISSQSNEKKKKKKKNPIDPQRKQSYKRRSEKGQGNENLQDMCKNHQGLQQEKRRNL